MVLALATLSLHTHTLLSFFIPTTTLEPAFLRPKWEKHRDTKNKKKNKARVGSNRYYTIAWHRCIGTFNNTFSFSLLIQRFFISHIDSSLFSWNRRSWRHVRPLGDSCFRSMASEPVHTSGTTQLKIPCKFILVNVLLQFLILQRIVDEYDRCEYPKSLKVVAKIAFTNPVL